MPLPTDERLLDVSDKLLAQFAQIFGEHPGFRPAHAKGTLLSGTFTPTAAAGELSAAAALPADVHAGSRATLGLDGFADDPGHRSECESQGHGRAFHARRTGPYRYRQPIPPTAFRPTPARSSLASSRRWQPVIRRNLMGSPLEAFLGSHPAALRLRADSQAQSPASFARRKAISGSRR